MMTSKAHQKEKHTTKGKLWLKTRLVHQCFIDIHIVLHIVYSTMLLQFVKEKVWWGGVHWLGTAGF